MFYCKAGKDRTGLLAMLILDVCRVPEDAILEDYHMCAAPLGHCATVRARCVSAEVK